MPANSSAETVSAEFYRTHVRRFFARLVLLCLIVWIYSVNFGIPQVELSATEISRNSSTLLK